MKNFTKQLLLLTSAAALCGFSFAATQGTLGTTSQGDVLLSVIVSPTPDAQISITGLEDFDWGNIVIPDNVSVNLPVLTKNNICVFMSDPGTYSISLTSVQGLNRLGPFEMVNPFDTNYATNYNATFTDGLGNSFTTGTNNGSDGIGMVPATSSSCAGTGDLASLTIDPGSVSTAFNGTINDYEQAVYEDTLIITVTPE